MLYKQVDYDVEQFDWNLIEKLKSTFKSDDDEILKRGHILSGERFNLWTFLRIPMGHYAFEIQSHLRHLAKQAKDHIIEVKEAAGFNSKKPEGEEYVDNLIAGNMGNINFDTGKGYHPEIVKNTGNNPFIDETHKIAVHYWEDCWSRINRLVCHVVGSALVMKETSGYDNIEAGEVLKLLDTNQGVPKFKYLPRIHEHHKDSMNTIMRQLIDGEYVWSSKVDSKKSLSKLAITPTQRNHFPKNYFASQLKPFIIFYREMVKKRGVEHIPIIMENILKHIYMSVTMSDVRPDYLDPTLYTNQDKKVDLTEESMLQQRVFKRIRLKDQTKVKENHDRLIASQTVIEKLFEEILKSKPATVDSLRKTLNPIFIAMGIEENDSFLSGSDAIKYLENFIVKELKIKFKQGDNK